MRKSLLLAAALTVMPLAAWSQERSGSEDRGYSDHRRDRDFDRMMHELGGMRGGGGGRGAAFFLRSGDATVAVRCDPNDSMRACVDVTLTLLEKARSVLPQSGGAAATPTPPTR